MESEGMRKAMDRAPYGSSGSWEDSRASGWHADFGWWRTSPHASDANPNAREDFNSLLSAAVKKPEQKD